MTTIYLIRHAEAEGNLYRRAQGHYDSNLTPLGRAQTAALAERFRHIPIHALWASDLIRAKSTAAAILKYHPGLTLRTTPRLREVDVGPWEDVPWGNIDRAYHDQLDYFTNDPARWSVPGGEDYGDLTRRVEQAVLALAQAYGGQTIAIVSHGLAIRALLCRLLGVGSQEIGRIPYGDNTAVSLLEAENGRLRVRWYNDSSHLDGASSTFARQSWWRKKPGPQLYTYFDPLDVQAESELYSHCYAQTWMSSHGNLTGYAPVIYLRMAQRHAAQDPRCVMKLTLGERFAGLIELDPDRDRDSGAGWISLIYIDPALRGQRLGAQLVGHAVSYFRRAGRSRIRLHVSQTNETALGFYGHAGFRPIGQTSGVGGPLYLMELDITPRTLGPGDIR